VVDLLEYKKIICYNGSIYNFMVSYNTLDNTPDQTSM